MERNRSERFSRLLRYYGVENENILAAFDEVPREHFIATKRNHWNVYLDEVVVTYNDGVNFSTSSQPSLMAMYMCWGELKEDSVVLEIGSGTGYNAAVMSRVCRKGMVYGVEYVKEMVEFANDTIRTLGYDNVLITQGDGYFGLQEHAPFDAIIVTVGAYTISPYWYRQLRENGKMVVPINLETLRSNPTIVLRKTNGRLIGAFTSHTRFIKMKGESERKYFEKLEKLRSLEKYKYAGERRWWMPLDVTEFVSQRVYCSTEVYYIGNNGYARLKGDRWLMFGNVEESLEKLEEAWNNTGRKGMFRLRYSITFDEEGNMEVEMGENRGT